jgi:hypothetical protein
MFPLAHFAKDTFPLQLLFEKAKRLIDIVVADKYLHGYPSRQENVVGARLCLIVAGLARRLMAAREDFVFAR